MSATAFFFITLGALVAAKCAARIAVNSGHFDGLPRPSQIDCPRSARHDPIIGTQH